MARRERNLKYRLVQLVVIKEYDSIKDIEEVFNLQSKYYTNLERYAVYRQDKRGQWCAWLDPVDLDNMVNGKLNTDWDDDLDFGDDDDD